MTLLYRNRDFQLHDTGRHPESPLRLASIDKMIDNAVFKNINEASWSTIKPLDIDFLLKVHDRDQVALVEQITDAGGGSIDADTIVSRNSLSVALKACGCVIHAIDAVLDNRDTNALCLVRPPGHHATEKQSMGFCLFNNVALGAMWAMQRYEVDKILIVDWDVHHGNGTQDIFYATENVFFFSTHRFPFYPGTGDVNETGTGPGLGTTLNRPLPFGTSESQFIDAFRVGVESAADKIKPDLVLISAGFDAHLADPIGGLGLTSEAFKTLTNIVKDVANLHCDGRIVSCLEGGYNLSALAESVACHLASLAQPT